MAEIRSASEGHRAPPPSGFGPWLREWRLGTGLSQADLAQSVGTSVDSVRRWEHGVNLPRSKFRRALAEVVGITLGELHHVMGLTSLASDSNVVTLPHLSGRTAVEGVVSPVRREQREEFTAAVMKGVRDGHATSPHWNAAVNQLARHLDIDW